MESIWNMWIPHGICGFHMEYVVDSTCNPEKYFMENYTKIAGLLAKKIPYGIRLECGGIVKTSVQVILGRFSVIQRAGQKIVPGWEKLQYIIALIQFLCHCIDLPQVSITKPT